MSKQTQAKISPKNKEEEQEEEKENKQQKKKKEIMKFQWVNQRASESTKHTAEKKMCVYGVCYCMRACVSVCEVRACVYIYCACLCASVRVYIRVCKMRASSCGK